MTPETIVREITEKLPGVVPKASYGETALFYNPGRALPNGVYFCTIKERDGANDKASRLDREGVFRLSLSLSGEAYESRFGPRPPRPTKGETVVGGHDFAALDKLTPHPVYAWMGWAQILNPSEESFRRLFPLVEAGHRAAAEKFGRKTEKR